VKYFYLGGIDAYRLIVNDDYSRDLYPAKIYPRSETVDFQRVNWNGVEGTSISTRGATTWMWSTVQRLFPRRNNYRGIQ